MRSHADVLRQAWRAGVLDHKLRAHQRPLYEFIDGCGDVRSVIKCARRFGKTFSVLLWCLEQCIRRPGIQVRFAAPTEKALRKIIRPNLRILLRDCPDEFKPRWNTQDSALEFPNGSEWHFAGTDNDNAEKLRGTGADIVVIDEAGYHADLEYVVNDLLLPQTIDTGGRMILISTPPRTPAHPFTAMAADAYAKGALYTRTLDDNTHLTPAQKEKYIEAMGGRGSDAVERELYCKDVVDSTRAIVPEFEAALQQIVRVPEVPEWFHPLIAMDVGFEDFHAIGFGWWDFRRAEAVLWDEVYLRQATTDRIAEAIKAKEAEHFPWMAQEQEQMPDGAYRLEPWRKERRKLFRYSDTDLRLIADLASMHGIAFQPTAKDNLEAQVNELRMLARHAKLAIHPRCTNTIAHLRYGIWNKQRTQFERTKEFGHFDGCAMMVYFIRNAPRHLNPYPALRSLTNPLTHQINPVMDEPVRTPLAGAVATLLGRA